MNLLVPKITLTPTPSEGKDTKERYLSPPVSEPRDVITTPRVNISYLDDVKMVNEYVFGETIGMGSYGKVKLAQRQGDDQKYAIKVMNRRVLSRKKVAGGQKTMWDEAKSEMALLKKLKHPNIVTLYEIIDDDESDLVYLVMEYMGGGCAQENIEERLDLEKVRGYIRDVLKGLDYCHAHHIVHRDIKPCNLLLTEDGVCKLADFGVASVFDTETDLTIDTAGTAMFFSPEACTGLPFSCLPNDMWALGVTIYVLVFGKLPFTGETMPELLENIKQRPLRFPDEPVVPETLIDCLKGLLSKNVKTRITTDGLRNHPWITKGGQLLPLVPYLKTGVSDVELNAAISDLKTFHFIQGSNRRSSIIATYRNFVRRRSVDGISPAKISASTLPKTFEEIEARTPKIREEEVHTFESPTAKAQTSKSGLIRRGSLPDRSATLDASQFEFHLKDLVEDGNAASMRIVVEEQLANSQKLSYANAESQVIETGDKHYLSVSEGDSHFLASVTSDEQPRQVTLSENDYIRDDYSLNSDSAYLYDVASPSDTGSVVITEDSSND